MRRTAKFRQWVRIIEERSKVLSEEVISRFSIVTEQNRIESTTVLLSKPADSCGIKFRSAIGIDYQFISSEQERICYLDSQFHWPRLPSSLMVLRLPSCSLLRGELKIGSGDVPIEDI